MPAASCQGKRERTLVVPVVYPTSDGRDEVFESLVCYAQFCFAPGGGGESEAGNGLFALKVALIPGIFFTLLLVDTWHAVRGQCRARRNNFCSPSDQL